MFGYRSQSAPVHVVPPQQYSVHPTGFNTGYTLLPVPTTPTNGMFYYNDQAVDNQTPFPMVPPLQQHPSTKRKRKTIVVRDPNQDNKDITEEIISEAGRSRKPTLPVGNVFSVPMPLQTTTHQPMQLQWCISRYFLIYWIIVTTQVVNIL
ncbi:eukaryotic translation initiation factor 4 gamma 3-like isoform X2 [Silurus meridionalis]|uniref:eukaryotic translation initiation factor 4 gamma 3-like isoform X2 n=1 Tax=Silurus meridionalis TaxID=175797 RepID=UPI001EE9E375|nr:eukaryotic translation initiation factor 4 gamma 3-like isoform X2 [Silurus meridionalis]